jgi:predicted Zn-dependent peptidase
VSLLVAGEVRRERLRSGLQLITEQVPGSRTFSLGFFVPVGSRHESPRLNGASHFLEHLLFKGTRRRTAEEISLAVEAVGGDLNAYTAKEHTCFYARVVDLDADVATDVLADMITSSLLNAADLESERGVILDEIATQLDDPAEVAHELISTAIFGPVGLGAPVIGSADSIRSLTRAQVARHWVRHYLLSTMAVVATGLVDHDRLREQLEQLAESRSSTKVPLSSSSERGHDPSPELVEGSGRDTGVLTVNRAVEQTSAVLAFLGPGVFDPRRYPLGLLSAIIGGGMSSRLFVEVRERRGLTYGIDAGETAYTDAGLWTVDWQCAPERLGEITSIVRSVLQDVADAGVADDELARAKSQLRGQTVLAYEGPVSRMNRLGTNALIGDERTLTELLEQYDAVSSEEVQRVAADLFTQPPVLAVVGPRVALRGVRKLLATWPS